MVREGSESTALALFETDKTDNGVAPHSLRWALKYFGRLLQDAEPVDFTLFGLCSISTYLGIPQRRGVFFLSVGKPYA